VVSAILERRKIKREALSLGVSSATGQKSSAGSPQSLPTSFMGADPDQREAENAFAADDWLTVEVLEEVRQLWLVSETPEEQNWLKATVPAEVLQRAIA
jgi:hypothetical protein